MQPRFPGRGPELKQRVRSTDQSDISDQVRQLCTCPSSRPRLRREGGLFLQFVSGGSEHRRTTCSGPASTAYAAGNTEPTILKTSSDNKNFLEGTVDLFLFSCFNSKMRDHTHWGSMQPGQNLVVVSLAGGGRPSRAGPARLGIRQRRPRRPSARSVRAGGTLGGDRLASAVRFRQTTVYSLTGRARQKLGPKKKRSAQRGERIAGHTGAQASRLAGSRAQQPSLAVDDPALSAYRNLNI